MTVLVPTFDEFTAGAGGAPPAGGGAGGGGGFSSAIGDFNIGNSPIEGSGAPTPPIGSAQFNPPLSDLLIEVYERCGIEATQLETKHIVSARRTMNLTQSRWANRGINLWKMSLIATPMVQGQAIYAVDASIMDIFDVYRRITVGSDLVDTYMTPISPTDYAMIPVKLQQSPPTSYWFQKSPASGPMNINVWPVPDAAGPYTLLYWAFVRLSDAQIENGGVLDVRFNFYEAWCADVAAALSVKWAPSRTQGLTLLAKDIWQEAADADTEHAPMHLAPDLSAYFR